MRSILQLLLVALLGLAVGVVAGWLTVGRSLTPPPLTLQASTPLAPEVATAPLLAAEPVVARGPQAAPTPTDAAAAPPAAQAAPPTPQPTAPPPAPTASATPPLHPGVDPIAASLVPRGPGRFALLDLEAAGVTQLIVRQGVLQRDGAANWSTFANRARLAVLHGPLARVELLHLGFDAEARPVVAHVRTTGHAGGEIEGVVPLKTGEALVGVRADDSVPPPDAAPAPGAPAPSVP